MRQFIWYSPELDCYVLQTIMEDCYTAFEWQVEDMVRVRELIGDENGNVVDPLCEFLWMAVGEL